MTTTAKNITDPDTDAIVLCALRYAFQRRSYIPSLVQLYIIRNWQQLDSGRTRTRIIREIRDHISDAEQLGTYKEEHTFILNRWKNTLHTLENNITTRP